MEILQKQISMFGEEKLTSLPEDSLVNHTHRQGNKREKQITATSGRRCLEQLDKFSQVGSLAKTFLAFLIGKGEWYSTKSKLIWKVQGLSYCHLVYCRLVAKTLRTAGKDFGLWPTVILLPTPKSTEIDETLEQWEKRRQNPKAKMMGPSLTVVAKMLPTPMKDDYKGRQKTENWVGNDLCSVLQPINNNGKISQLNPRFVAEMMGYPPNWLELPFQNIEQNQLKDMETQ